MNEELNGNPSREEEVGEWKYLGRELIRRTKQPWKHVSLVLYVLVAIVVFGGLGIWVEIVKIGTADEFRGTSELFAAMATFYPALVGASALQMIFLSLDSANKIMGAFAIAAWVLSIVMGLLVAVFYSGSPTTCITLVVVMGIAAVWLWMIAHADDPIYKRGRIDSASGGSTDRPLKGNTGDFKVN